MHRNWLIPDPLEADKRFIRTNPAAIGMHGIWTGENGKLWAVIPSSHINQFGNGIVGASAKLEGAVKTGITIAPRKVKQIKEN